MCMYNYTGAKSMELDACMVQATIICVNGSDFRKKVEDGRLLFLTIKQTTGT